MGSSRKCTDSTALIELAEEFGVDKETVMGLANIPLKKVADEVSKIAPDGEKGQKAKDFLDAADEADIIHVSEKRYTLS
jgi:uncharacterized protein YidB (DUF937 family)